MASTSEHVPDILSEEPTTIENPTQPPAAAEIVDWIEPDNTFGKEWQCFWRSRVKMGSRFHAKCKHCDAPPTEGRLDRMVKHITIGCKIDPLLKAQYLSSLDMPQNNKRVRNSDKDIVNKLNTQSSLHSFFRRPISENEKGM